MRRHRAILIGTAVLLLGPVAVGAQEPQKVPRVGVLLPGSSPSASEASPNLDAFRRGLREHGYVEGRTIAIEYRFGEGRDDRLPGLAAELVGLNVDVIVTATGPAILAAKRATTTIPIVMAATGDPVGTGLVDSLARPGGNLTGMSTLDTELTGKRLELLKEAVSGLSHVGAVWSANDFGMEIAFARVAHAAELLGLRLRDMGIRDPADFPAVFDTAAGARLDAVIVLAQPFTQRHRAQIVELVARNRLPAMYTLRGFVDGGGLMSYGPIVAEMYRRAASHVDRILKGAKPSEMPIEQPTKFELVVNLKTAKALGLTIPESILARADEVIE